MVSVNSTMLALGSTAAPFELPDPTGRTFTFDDVAGERGTLVMFVCNHCPYVKHLGAKLGELSADWQAAGIGVVAINSNDFSKYPDDAPELMPAAAAEWGWSFPYLVDKDQAVARAYQAACTPDFYLFNGRKELVYRGRFDESTPRNDAPLTGNELSGAVTKVIAGQDIPAEQMPSIGCNIKWLPGNQPSWFILG